MSGIGYAGVALVVVNGRDELPCFAASVLLRDAGVR